MTLSLHVLIACLAAYLLGSIPFGLLTARWVRGIDIREHGSRNVGATNVFRVIGRGWGLLVLFLDALKGALAVILARQLTGGDEAAYNAVLLCGIIAILGHSFPVWLRFRGGKGVATSLGVFLGLAWAPTLLTLTAWSIVFGLTRIISVASLAAAVLFPAAVWLLAHQETGFPGLFGVSLLLAVFILYTHRSNIARLRRGEEKRLF